MFRCLQNIRFLFAPIVMALVSLALLAACGDNTSVAGGSSEETNAIVGIVVDENGNPSSGARVSLFDANYMPVAGALSKAGEITLTPLELVRTSTEADSNGEWKFSNIPAGRYRLETQSTQGHKAAKILEVPEYGLVEAGASMVRPAGALQGMVTMMGEAASGAKVRIPGSDYFTVCDEYGYFKIDNLPQDSLTLVFQVSDPRVTPIHSLTALPNIAMKNSPKPILSEGWDGNATKDAGDMLWVNIPFVQDSILITYWNWDTISAGAFPDQNGAMPNGVLYGGELESSPWEMALKLNGSSDFAVVEPQALSLQNLAPYTLSLFIYLEPETTEDSLHLNLLGQLGFDDEKDVFSLALIRNMCGYSDLQAGFFLGTGNSTRLSCDDLHTSENAILNEGEWTHLAVSYHKAGLLSLHLNGQPVLRDTVIVEDYTLAESLPWYFGKSNFHGKLDEVKIFSEALSDADIRQLFETTWESAESDFRQQMDQQK